MRIQDGYNTTHAYIYIYIRGLRYCIYIYIYTYIYIKHCVLSKRQFYLFDLDPVVS